MAEENEMDPGAPEGEPVEVTETVTENDEPRAHRGRRRALKAAKLLGIFVAALILLVVAAIFALNTQPGRDLR